MSTNPPNPFEYYSLMALMGQNSQNIQGDESNKNDLIAPTASTSTNVVTTTPSTLSIDTQTRTETWEPPTMVSSTIIPITPTTFSFPNGNPMLNGSNFRSTNFAVSPNMPLNFPSESIYAVAVKLPLFWTDNPVAWFHQAEAQFQLKKVSQDRTKYEYIITALPQEVTSTVLDVLENPPSANLYENLKKILIERHSLSEEVRLEKILSEAMTNHYQKPSEMYRHLVSLAGKSGTFNQQLLVKLWKRKLPGLTQSLLQIVKSENPQELIEMADKIYETNERNNVSILSQSSQSTSFPPMLPNPPQTIVPQQPQITQQIPMTSQPKLVQSHATQQPQTNQQPQTSQQPVNLAPVNSAGSFDPSTFMSQFYVAMSQLNSKFQSLETQIAEIRENKQQEHNSRSRFRSKSPVPNIRFRSRSNSNGRNLRKNSKYCYFHRRFGMDAEKCTPPCQFKPIENTNSKN